MLTTDNDERVRALIRLDRYFDAYLYIGHYVDSRVLIHADETNSAVAEYQRLQDEREGIQITFALIFIVVALLLLLAAVWIALLFAGRLSGPVSSLVRAAERVRIGDLTSRVPEGPADDEIGSLSRAFNRMISQLAAQRAELITTNSQLDERRRFTEAVLSGVSSGVIGLTAEGRVHLANRAAIQSLGMEPQSLAARPSQSWCRSLRRCSRRPACVRTGLPRRKWRSGTATLHAPCLHELRRSRTNKAFTVSSSRSTT